MTVVERALVLRQPWVSRVVRGEFPALLRKTNTNIRGPVAVLASTTFDGLSGAENPDDFPAGVVVGCVNIADCRPIDGDPLVALLDAFGEHAASQYPKHFFEKPGKTWLWSIDHPIAFKVPVETDVKINMVWSRIPPLDIERYG